MALTDTEIKRAKPQNKGHKLVDGRGLMLLVQPNGSKLWRYRYKYLGKETMLSLGCYPDVGLAEAREKAIAARKLLREGISPAGQRREEKRLAKFNADNTFRAVAEDWYQTNRKKWIEDHAQRLWRRLENHILPRIGNRAVADISTLELLEVIRRPEKADKCETAHRLLQTCRSIFQYAILTQKIHYNPANDLKGVLRSYRVENYPSIGHNQIPEFMDRLEGVQTTSLNRLAIKMLALTFVRQGELRQAKWADIDFASAEWRIRPETTKMRTLHHVHLSEQTVKVLREIQHITGESEYVFASQQRRKHPFMSENTINNVLHKMGYQGMLVGHGFRSMASTILNENGFRADVIERQLAHMPRDKVRAAYNRAEYLTERREMMQWWGDYLQKAGLQI